MGTLHGMGVRVSFKMNELLPIFVVDKSQLVEIALCCQWFILQKQPHTLISLKQHLIQGPME